MSNDILQRSDEWHSLRNGKFTASTFGDLMGTGRSKVKGKREEFTAAGRTLIIEKVTEIMTGKSKTIKGEALDWGTYYEGEAIEAYIKKSSNKVEEVGFIPMPGHEEYAGGSPDGVIYKKDYNKKFIYKENGDLVIDGIIEIKCPFNSANHVSTILRDDLPAMVANKYYTQMQFNMLCTGAEWCDFVSYDPRILKEENRIHIIRYERDEDFIVKLLIKLVCAVNELKEMLEILG